VSIVGTVESLWRYPIKSMRGEELNEIFAGYAGVYGDRLFAFENSTGLYGAVLAEGMIRKGDPVELLN
jgi:uncharacterized protein